MTTATVRHVARIRITPAGPVDVLAQNGSDTVRLLDPNTGRVRETRAVPNYGTSFGELLSRPTLKIGVAQFPAGDWVVYYYDPGDECFGYALNVDRPDWSEWGFAPFGA